MITVTISNKRHLAAASAAWLKTIPTQPEQGDPIPWPYPTVEDYVQAAIERVHESWRDSTRSDVISTAQFIRRIPAQAFATILVAAEQSPELQAYLARLDAEPMVWLGADETIAGVAALVAFGFLTQEQADVVLHYDIPSPPQ